MPLMFALAGRRPRPKISHLSNTITFVGSTPTQIASATSISIPVPTGAAAGDLLIVGTLNRGGSGGITPTGWTLVSASAAASFSGSSTSQYGSIYTRVYQPGDPTSFTFTQSINDRINGVMLAFRSAAGISVGVQANSVSSNDSGNVATIAPVTPAEAGFVVAMATSIIAVIPDTNATAWTASSGWTIEGSSIAEALRLGIAYQPSVVGTPVSGSFTSEFGTPTLGGFTSNTIGLQSP